MGGNALSQETIGLTKYLLERMQEMQKQDPAYLKGLKDSYVSAFGQPESANDACTGEDRELWWLHEMGQYRVDRMRAEQSGKIRSKR